MGPPSNQHHKRAAAAAGVTAESLKRSRKSRTNKGVWLLVWEGASCTNGTDKTIRNLLDWRLPNMKKFTRRLASMCCFFVLLLRIFSTEQRRNNSIQQVLLPMGQQFVDSILSSNAGGSAVFEKAIDTKAQQLSAQNLRYYMYDEPEITLKGWIFKRHPDIWWWKAEEKNDEQMFRALEKSPLRTRNPNDADLFIIPIPFAKLLMQSNWNLLVHVNDTQPKMRAKKAMRLAIEALTKHPLFRKHWGMRHVLLNTPDACYRYFQPLNSFYDLMAPYYGLLYNVTAMLA